MLKIVLPFNHIILHLSNNYHIHFFQTYKELRFLMAYKYNVSCSEAVSKNWTPSAIDCYLIGCSCSKCNLNKIYFAKSQIRCRMKETVIELVRRLGVPKEV